MTICLGALCAKDGGRAATAGVVASDRMVTLGGLIEFDHSAPKMTSLGKGVVGLVAGDALTGSSLLRDVRDAARGSGAKLPDLAQRLAEMYGEVRIARAAATLLQPRGLTLKSFYENHQKLLPMIVGGIDQQLLGFDLGVQILVLGVDDQGGHLFTVSNPGGRYDAHDVIGYAAIGSGALHALQAMIGFGHSTGENLRETVFRAYAAKRRSEVAPGVGRETDLLVVDPSGASRLSTDTLKELEDLYRTYTESTEKNLGAKLGKLELEQEAIT